MPNKLGSTCQNISATITGDQLDIELDVAISQLKLKALVDSGARLSVIDSRIVSKLPIKIQSKLTKLREPITLNFASKSVSQGRITHIITVPLSVGNLHFPWTFHILPTYNDIILGMDFIKATKLGWQWTDTGSSNLQLQFCLPEKSTPEPSTSQSVRVIRPVSIPPQTAKKVKVHIKGLQTTECILFEPNITTLSKCELMIPRCLVQVETGETYLHVFNPTNNHLQLSRRISLGSVSTIVSYSGNVDAFDNALLRSIKATDSGSIDPEIATITLPEHLSPAEKQDLLLLLSRYRMAFAFSSSELGKCNIMKHSVDLIDPTPVRCRPYRVSQVERAEINRQVQDMLDNGIIQPSFSPFASPVVLCKKKDGTMRFCVDFRNVNSKSRKLCWPLPRIDDALDRLSGCKYFTALDVLSAYHQVEMEETSREITAFTKPDGNYEFLRMPFGLSGAPITYQRLMDKCLSGLKESFCLVFLDDILIPGKSLEEHNSRLELVLQKLIDAGLTLKPSECNFAMKKVLYLGHVISEAGVEVNPEKVKAVREFKRPECIKDVRSFVSLCSYYRKFIPFFSKIARPLNQLLQKDVKFRWSEECEEAFKLFKEKLITAPILAHFDPTAPTELHTDASSIHGLGCVLMQIIAGEKRVIAYSSRTLNSAERNYHVTELECLAIVHGVKVFRHYIYGKPVTVVVDHCSLCHLLRMRDPTKRISRWALLLQEFDLNIVYTSGRKHLCPDALSRNPVDAAPTEEVDFPEVMLCRIAPISLAAIYEAQQSDKHCNMVMGRLEAGYYNGFLGYQLVDGILYYSNPKRRNGERRLVVPSGFRQLVLTSIHSDPCGAHFGVFKCYDILKLRFFWPKMKRDLRRFIQSCEICQRYNRRNHPEFGPYCPIPATDKPFEYVGVDKIGGFPVSPFGNRFVVLMTDYFTRFIEFYTIPAETTFYCIRALVNCVLSRHAIPKTLFLDQATCFTSQEFQAFATHFNISLEFTSKGSHHSTGCSEKNNDTVKRVISKYIGEHSSWEVLLPWAVYAHNISVHHVTKFSPYELLYGRVPLIPCDKLFSNFHIQLRQFDPSAYSIAYTNDATHKLVQASKYNASHEERHFSAGDIVLVQGFRRRAGQVTKFQAVFEGPYVVKEVCSPRRLRLLDCRQKQHLKARLANSRLTRPFLPPYNADGGKPVFSKEYSTALLLSKALRDTQPIIRRAFSNSAIVDSRDKVSNPGLYNLFSVQSMSSEKNFVLAAAEQIPAGQEEDLDVLSIHADEETDKLLESYPHQVHCIPIENADGTISYLALSLDEHDKLRQSFIHTTSKDAKPPGKFFATKEISLSELIESLPALPPVSYNPPCEPISEDEEGKGHLSGSSTSSATEKTRENPSMELEPISEEETEFTYHHTPEKAIHNGSSIRATYSRRKQKPQMSLRRLSSNRPRSPLIRRIAPPRTPSPPPPVTFRKRRKVGVQQRARMKRRLLREQQPDITVIVDLSSTGSVAGGEGEM